MIDPRRVLDNRKDSGDNPARSNNRDAKDTER
jgi:hypothetical protein